MTYSPHPLDTSLISLPSQLERDVELIARHNHDVWANGRIQEGWSYGHERNDKLKTHPGLVPYEELSEAEKDYDRRSVIESLKGAMALGYTVQKIS